MADDQRIRVLVLGARGMAGHMISSYLNEAGREVVPAARGVESIPGFVCLDVLDDAGLSDLVTGGRFDVIVNCVGALVAQSAGSPEMAVRLNALLPRRLEGLTAKLDTRVIHLSTDCVFSGHTGPYVESALRDGDTTYDRAKALGELDNSKDLTLRMSIIGPEVRSTGTGLMHWFLKQSGLVGGYTRAIWNGITTLELAKAIDRIIDSELSGIYHLVPPYSISKHDLLVLIAEIFGRRDLEVRPDHSIVIDKTLIDTRGTSPYRVGRTGYEGMLQELREWIVAHPNLYGSQQRYRVGARR